MSARRLLPSKRPVGAGDVEQVTPDVLVTARVFTILWAIAHLMPLLREPEPGVVVVWIVLGAALLVLDRPTSRWRLALLCIAQLLYLGYQLPFAKNHVMIMACVDLGLLISVLYSLRRDRGAVDGPPPVGALPFVRVAFLVAYGAAALAKLNHGFFDADSSCANVLFEDSASFIGGPFVDLTDVLAPAMPFVIAAIELGIPVLLIVPATRVFGVAVTVVFHLIVSLSPTAIALGFLITLLPLVFLFLPAPAAGHLRDRVIKIGTRNGRLKWQRSTLLVVAAIVLGALLTRDIWQLVDVGSDPNWLAAAPVAIVMAALLLDAAWQAWREGWPRTLTFAPRGIFYYVALALMVVNAASPYLGGKTMNSFTMYSNLQTERHSSNHFFLPRVSLGNGQDDLVEVVASSNRGLRGLSKSGELITWHEFRRRLSRDPDASISYRRQGKLFEYAEARDNPELVEFDDLNARLMGYRLIDPVGDPVRCRW